ncbi:MAG: T9SS type A sorting domain-containing protein [Bacteroidetes bacterium]|nr:T9SS type A sorting domain-containing protein [Bacteroidota bacterium]
MTRKRTILRLNILLAICFSTITICAQQLNFERTYGLPGYNYGKRVLQTEDNGYLILGNKSGFTGSSDIYLIKTGTLGKLVWDKAIGNASIEVAEDMKPTFDKGYIIAGYSNYGANNDYQLLLIKIDSLYNVEWLKNFGGTNWDFGYSVVQSPDSGFIVAGETYSYGNGANDVFILKTDLNGNKLWHKAYGGQNEDVAMCIVNSDTNYLLTGYTNSFGNGQYDCYVLCFDASGDTLWTRTFGDSLDDKAFSIMHTNDKNIIIAGSTENYGAVKIDGLIIKIDSMGNQIWTNKHGGQEDDQFFHCLMEPNNDMLFTGYTESFGYDKKDVYLVLSDNYGNFKETNTFGRAKNDNANSIINTSDNAYALIGSTTSLGIGESNIYFIKTDSLLQIDNNTYSHELNILEIEDEDFFQICLFPNPSDGKFSIISKKLNIKNAVLEVYDVNGRKVYDKSEIYLNPNSLLNFEISHLNNGFYFIKILNNDYSIIRKLIIKK